MKKVIWTSIFNSEQLTGESDLSVVGHNSLGEELVRVYDELGMPIQTRLKDVVIIETPSATEALVSSARDSLEILEKLDVTFPMWNVRPLIDRLRSALAEIESK